VVFSVFLNEVFLLRDRANVKICNESEYRQFVNQIPDLCADGFVSSEYCSLFHVDFDESRAKLLEAYREFVTCCDWLSGCRLDDYATNFSPDSLRIKSKIEASSGRSVSNGCLIVAVKFLDIPHTTLGNTPNIAVAISRFCARFQVTATSSL